MLQTQSPHILTALENIRAMMESTGSDRAQNALNAMLAVLSALDDDVYSPYSVLIALLGHITYCQADREESLKFIVNGIITSWTTAAEVDLEEAMKQSKQETRH